MEARGLLIDAFGRISEEVHLAAEGLPTEALVWRPDPDANSIAWLVWHLARVHPAHRPTPPPPQPARRNNRNTQRQPQPGRPA